MSSQPYPPQQPEQDHQHDETNNPGYQSNQPPQSYPPGEISRTPYTPEPNQQGYQQRDPGQAQYPPYPSNAPNSGYRQIPETPIPPYQQPMYPYQGNPVPYGDQGYKSANNLVSSSDMGAIHAESHYSTYRDAMGNLVESRQQVFEDQNQMRANIRYWSKTIIYFLLGALEVILLLRFIFRLLGANAYNNFISFLYGLSHPFVVPFNGIFNDQTLGKGGVFEFSTLVAMVIYALLAWGLVALIRILFAPVRASRQSVTTTRRNMF